MSSPQQIFTLTPLAPVHEDDPPPDGGLHARAFVNFRNAHLLAFGGSGHTIPSLKTLSDENWVYFSSTSAAPATEDTDTIQNWERSPLIEVSLQVINAEPGRQILLRVQVMGLGPNGRVRVALGRKVLQTMQVPENEQTTISHALPIPPEREWVYYDIKHIRQEDGEASALKVTEIAGFLI